MKKYKFRYIIFKLLKILFFLLTIITLIYIILKLFISLFISNTLANEDYTLTEPISILLIGSDYVKDDPDRIGARADSQIVLTINPENKRGNIEFEFVSIPRDTLAPIPCGPDGLIYDKITHSLMYGLGEDISDEKINEAITCAQTTVENLLNIEIDYYVVATFQSIIEMVDAVDGIEVNSSREFCVQDENDTGYDPYGACAPGSLKIEKGEQILDGQHALAYARERITSSDYDRNLRQQEVITQIIKKVLANPVKYGDDFYKAFKNTCKTNIKLPDIKDYINFATALYNNVNLNLSEDVPVYIDNKTSIYENIPMYTISTIVNEDKKSIDPVQMLELYGEENVEEFEEYVYIFRQEVTKEQLSVPTKIYDEEQEHKKLEPIVIEFSSFSAKVIEYSTPEAFYSYIDPDTLNYISNLLRTSLNEPIGSIAYFNYNILENEYLIPVQRNEQFVMLESQELSDYDIPTSQYEAEENNMLNEQNDAEINALPNEQHNDDIINQEQDNS